MIISRKPLMLFDVDVIAGAVLLVIALVAWFAVIVPARANGADYRDLSAKIDAANAAVAAASEKLNVVQIQTERLRAGVRTQSDAAPKPDALTPFLSLVSTLAAECGVTIAQVVPAPLRANDGYLSTDIRLSGTGGSLDFARFLDRLACKHRYFSLEEYAIKRSPIQAAQQCDISWIVRLYMLDEKPETRKEALP